MGDKYFKFFIIYGRKFARFANFDYLCSAKCDSKLQIESHNLKLKVWIPAIRENGGDCYFKT